jgi:hypothetical protein
MVSVLSCKTFSCQGIFLLFIAPRFQFVDPPHISAEAVDTETPFDYRRGGYYHIGLTVPNVPEVVKKMEKLGAKQVGELCEVGRDSIVYVKDPWGNMVELLSTSFESFLANTG